MQNASVGPQILFPPRPANLDSAGREQPDPVPLERDEPDRRKQNGHTQQCRSTPTRDRAFGFD
jgi:hypothetical protein